jgi:MarR family transcriptional regulator, negative regulator of the multidrug operon emrRAB
VDRTTNLLGALALMLADAMEHQAAEVVGRSGAAGAALAVLLQDPDLGVQGLRRPLGLTQSATVRLVDSLVADGLARRAPGPDGRSIRIALTTAGRREARAVLAARAAVLERAMAALTATERRQLGGILGRILPALTEGPDHAELVCRLCDLTACPGERCPVEQHEAGRA